MYKSLLSDYEASQRSLMLENAELKKVLQQMKKEMIHILSPRQSSSRRATADDSQEQVFVYSYSKVFKPRSLASFVTVIERPGN